MSSRPFCQVVRTVNATMAISRGSHAPLTSLVRCPTACGRPATSWSPSRPCLGPMASSGGRPGWRPGSRQISMSSTWPPATTLAPGTARPWTSCAGWPPMSAPAARDPGRRPGPGYRPFRAGAPDHPDRDRVQPAQPVAAAHWWRLERDPGVIREGARSASTSTSSPCARRPWPRRRTVPPGIPASSRLRRQRSPGRLGSKDSSGPGPGVSALPGMTPRIPAPARPDRPG